MPGTPIVFGTDGWRGRIADDYTFEAVRRCAQGFALYLSAKEGTAPPVVVGYDKRFASEHFAAAAAEVLAANGFHVLLTDGATPTPVISYAVALAARSRPTEAGAPDFVKDYVSWGASIRASHYLVLGAKARAALAGRPHVSVQDVQSVAYPVLRHRIITNFRAESEGISSEEIIKRLLEAVLPPKSGL